ncbi:MAG: alpha-amylase family glycosyl hydrolase [Vicinamibacterales bacterium]
MPEALTLGALHANGQTAFRVWAPESRSVDVVGAAFRQPMTSEEHGYWTAVLDVPPGTLYRYRLDGADDRVFPDPASRFQPEGVHGPSQVVDPAAFAWSAVEWQPPSPRGLVFYELHVGTFTPEGTFNGVRDRLPYLRDLGVTAIELMPVADFPGRWNWGYDGVCLFAPSRAYGPPDDLRALVDAAHAHGLAIFLDVVYNHLGPDGAYANAFSPYYFTDRHQSPWGRGVNLDGPHSAAVRRFFVENAMHWAREYRIDGLRLDATHALVDEGPRHFLEELTTTVREAAARPVLFVAEDERDLREQLRPASQGGWGLNGVWADAFHHDVRVHVAGDRDGYFAKYGGATASIADRINDGLPGFVFCIQNHDQVGNRADGGRLHHAIDAAAYRAASTLLLLAPETPLIFMGQEWSAGTPFQFFTDHHPELGRRVTEGRRQEFKQFAAFADPAARDRLPDPQAPATFAASRLRWDEPAAPPHEAMLRLYRALLRLRRELPLDTLVARAYDEETIVLAGGGRLVIARLGGAGDCRAGRIDRTLFSTEDPSCADDPQPIVVSDGLVRFARAGALVAAGAPFAP